MPDCATINSQSGTVMQVYRTFHLGKLCMSQVLGLVAIYTIQFDANFMFFRSRCCVGTHQNTAKRLHYGACLLRSIISPFRDVYGPIFVELLSGKMVSAKITTFLLFLLSSFSYNFRSRIPTKCLILLLKVQGTS